MSEELLDEVEAINSIYGDGSLVRSSSEALDYILSLPDDRVSLRLQFSAEYPAVPPAVVGTNSSGEHGRRGQAARDLSLFRDALGNVYQPGEVCLFDAVEEFKRLLEEAAPEEDTHETTSTPDRDEKERNDIKASPFREEPAGLGPEPPWTTSDPIIEMKSTFIARTAHVTSPAQAAQYVQHLLASDKRVRSATHNITAWRIRGPNNTSFQDCDDDGETAAGGRVLHLMQLMDVWDVMVIITRWYGGQKLGPRRFAVINNVARDAFIKAGLVEEGTKKKGHGK